MTFEFSATDDLRDRRAIPQIDFVDANGIGDRGEITALDLRVVEIVEVVENGDFVPFANQLLDQMRTDKSGATRDENFHGARVRRKR